MSEHEYLNDGVQIMDWAEQLARFTDTAGVLTRTYLTPAHHGAAAQLAEWMCAAGMNVRRDVAGNVIGRYEGQTENAPALLTGSHFDSVRNGGKYDGNLGILLPIACIRRWHAAGRRFPFALEVIAFAEEEGVRFKATLLGSRAAAGTFDMAVLDNRDEDGLTMREVMAASGFHAAALNKAAYDPAQVLAFVEVHIEQGPVLLNENLPLGVVTAIAGASRFMVEATGLAGHAGTVPMALRRDAAMAAAEVGLYIERRCRDTPGAVGTVGQLGVPDGAANVVPGKAVFSIDIRAEDDAVRQTSWRKSNASGKAATCACMCKKRMKPAACPAPRGSGSNWRRRWKAATCRCGCCRRGQGTMRWRWRPSPTSQCCSCAAATAASATIRMKS
jgi:hydantoinase/carbamoylase family amidase